MMTAPGAHVTKGANNFLGEGRVDAVFRRFMEGDAVDILKIGACCEVVIGLGQYHHIKGMEEEKWSLHHRRQLVTSLPARRFRLLVNNWLGLN
jgi:hypothetical protein